MIIRPETTTDQAAVAEVVEAAFGSPTEAELVEAIRASVGYIADLALVAELEHAVVGHVMISRATLRDGDNSHEILTLSPLAVAPDSQGCGIGSKLVRAVVDRADATGKPLVVLEGSPAYYSPLGFEPASRHDITIDLPSWAPPEAAQVHRLTGYRPEVRGHVVYSAAFDAVLEP